VFTFIHCAGRAATQKVPNFKQFCVRVNPYYLPIKRMNFHNLFIEVHDILR
jgi:flagellar biosynthesis/type III secretory pathway protein FliH